MWSERDWITNTWKSVTNELSLCYASYNLDEKLEELRLSLPCYEKEPKN